jgi:DNA-binding Xre family transcriptional regulator
MDIIIGNVKKIIANKGLKYKAVAAKANINERRFYRIMQGVAEVNCTELAQICSALDVEPNDVYGINKSA